MDYANAGSGSEQLGAIADAALVVASSTQPRSNAVAVPDHILVAVDGTEAAQPALDHAVVLARHTGAALTGLFVIDTPWSEVSGGDLQPLDPPQGSMDHLREVQEQQARAAREQFERSVRDLPRTAFALLAGDPAESLLDALNSCDGQLLVLGRKVFQASGRHAPDAIGNRVAVGAQAPVVLFP